MEPVGGPPPPASPSADATALPPGWRLEEYEVQRTLGGGGFGITYLARDANLDLPIALKEYFPADLATRAGDLRVLVRGGDEDHAGQFEWGLERFLDEARALAAFRHPNIIRVLRYFRANGTAYIVMEYETGVSLKRWVPQNAPLSQRAVLGIARPLLDGLEQVHKAGFLHRDIKPDNIYVRTDNSPVLLDFGSARRFAANTDLTNIVSPGFAPFEQYHSQGHQGPWTDIYSLGAVLYWMVTGKKPVESAARVKTDTMLPASKLAEAAVYGDSLLAAIDWALSPEEDRRPQSVGEFRTALGNSANVDLELPSEGGDDKGAIAASGYARSMPSPSSTSQKRNLLGTILFLDLVGYSVRSVDDQAAIKRMFNELIGKALRGVAEESRIAIDTGDGAAICFMGDPEEALNSALLLRDLLGQRYKSLLAIRIGLHMGPVRVMTDLNGSVNVIGDGINVARRVMDFAQPNQVLVSRGYYDVISRITDDTAEMFLYLGNFEDKHGRMHELYSVGSGQRTVTTRKELPPGEIARAPVPFAEQFTDDSVHDIEVELARHIGPLSRVLVAKARPLAGSLQALREALAPTIQEPKARELFLSGAVTASHPPSHPSSRGRSAATHPRSQSAAPPSQPISSRPSQAVTGPADMSPEELAAIEVALSKFIGPMARIVVRKEAVRAQNFNALVAAVAANVDKKDQRDAFVAALHKALPRRQF
jgi:serine/threonine protein kinase